MGDRMRPLPFDRLMERALCEYAHSKTVFGITKNVSYAECEKPYIFGEKLEAPFGPAAGPHTQLAQNIISAYITGSRFFELKTVQTLDGEDLPVSKPCITAGDECYNCEWSTELYVGEARAEYIKAYFALKLLSREWGLGAPDGFVFNMSVGYDLDGIKSDKIDSFIEGLKDASATPEWRECADWTLSSLDRFKHIDKDYVNSISPRVSRSVTLSTLHGCPPSEIERIASYLLREKKLHTFVKCNPTILGYEFARETLDSMGYDYISFDDHHFLEDLQFTDAVPMIERLKALAYGLELEFGVKLTNTFPVDVKAGELPSEEMYMSGRSLFPLSVAVARKLGEAFKGDLRISFAGGADAYSIERLTEAGLWPVTMATTMLKPGGYERLVQIANIFDKPLYLPASVDITSLRGLEEGGKSDPYYTKPIKPGVVRKLAADAPLTSCFTAPCKASCPLGQDIPAYLRLAGEGKYLDALRVIYERNPLPFITGTICSHRCMEGCERTFYEGAVGIRGVKLVAAKEARSEFMRELGASKPASNGKRCAVIGGGPAGIAAGSLLACAGADVTVFEKTAELGGVVRHIIPGFRIGRDAIDNDIELAKAAGVTFETGVEVKSVDELKGRGFDEIILAVGASVPGSLTLRTGSALSVLSFLEKFKREPEKLSLGESVVVVGGGNTAMDAARAAKRVRGVKNVSIVYRRTKRYMPADEEELCLALEDGVIFEELLVPVGISDGYLSCTVCELGEPDASGRRGSVPTQETREIPCDTLIAAVGEGVDTNLYKSLGIETGAGGKPVLNDKLFSSSAGVFVIGDARRGPATVAEAIADALIVAEQITGESYARYGGLNAEGCAESAAAKKGLLDFNRKLSEPERCLECATVCRICADVCPNRANVAIKVPGTEMEQIVHLDGYCNECGNCEVFCPYASAPYKVKFTLFRDHADFMCSENPGFLPLGDGHILARLNGAVREYDLNASDLDKSVSLLCGALLRDYPYLVY